MDIVFTEITGSVPACHHLLASNTLQSNLNIKFQICHFINFLNDIIYHNLNQHSSINIIGVPSESLILKVLPIEVDGLIDVGGLASSYIWIEFLGFIFVFIFDHL